MLESDSSTCAWMFRGTAPAALLASVICLLFTLLMPNSRLNRIVKCVTFQIEFMVLKGKMGLNKQKKRSSENDHVSERSCVTMNLKQGIKRYIKAGGYYSYCRLLNILNLRNRMHIAKGNQVVSNGARFHNVKMLVSGVGNQVILDDRVSLKNCTIRIDGNHNTIRIGAKSVCNQVSFWVEDSDNLIELGEHCRLTGLTELAVTEGTQIRIGKNCLFSNHITFRTGDSHSIIDLQGRRRNPSESITIHDHVWIGAQVICLKGTEVAEGSVIGTGALLTKKFLDPNCIIAGSPAKVVRREMTWVGDRIPMDTDALKGL